VVKNVAGFDLTRLMVGAWGTLGVLTEVSVRLRGLPEHEATIAFPLPNAAPALTDLLARLRSAAVSPLALEIVSASLAARLGVGPRPMILARLAGNTEAVAAQHETFAALGEVSDTDASVWNALRVADLPDSTVVRFSGPAGQFPEVWLAADRLAALAGGYAHGSVLRSVARVVLPHTDGMLGEPVVGALRSATREVRIFERLPAALWPVLAPPAVHDRLSRGIRTAFDPHWLLNPGILGEERP